MKGTMAIEGDIVTALFTDGNTQVLGSWRIRRPKRIRVYLCRLRNVSPEGSTLRTRPMKSLCREWAAHNLLHGLHVRRSRTANVDFEADTGKAKAAAYFALAAVYGIFWKLLNKNEHD